MIRISNVRLRVNYNDFDLKIISAKKLNITADKIKEASLFRRSVDARKKTQVHFIAAIDVALTVDEHSIVQKCNDRQICIAPEFSYALPKEKRLPKFPVVVGAGPAGLFAALTLAQCGACPILIERGCDVDRREHDVRSFWKSGKLNVNSNIQFGEGGAGAFSDGKLNTGTKDKRSRHVLNTFVSHGAPKEILFDARPHIGTDNLPSTIKSIRREIISLGGKVMFETALTGLITKDNQLCGIQVTKNGVTNKIETGQLILAIGHSARDTFEYLESKQIPMMQKAFSVGARIEHLQQMVNNAQYGDFSGKGHLGSADYKLAVHLKDGTGVYTFCMCPGGTVVAAASEENLLCTNGMSTFERGNTNANSALLVSVTPKQFGSEEVLAGMYFQRELEKQAYILGGGGYHAPVQRVEDFLKNRKSKALGEVIPSYTAGYTLSDLHKCLPVHISTAMAQGIVQMDRKLKGFAHPDAVLTAVETKSSSPVRILRSEAFESVKIKGLYPCGEGAGYAGGIISAAVDGIKCAEAMIHNCNV